MQFLNLEYGTRPAPQAVKRGRKNEHTKSETKNTMQWARPDDADGDEGRAGTPPKRGKEGEGGEAETTTETTTKTTATKTRDNTERERKKKRKRKKGQNSEGPPQHNRNRLSRTQSEPFRNAQKPLTPPK